MIDVVDCVKRRPRTWYGEIRGEFPPGQTGEMELCNSRYYFCFFGMVAWLIGVLDRGRRFLGLVWSTQYQHVNRLDCSALRIFTDRMYIWAKCQKTGYLRLIDNMRELKMSKMRTDLIWFYSAQRLAKVNKYSWFKHCPQLGKQVTYSYINAYRPEVIVNRPEVANVNILTGRTVQRARSLWTGCKPELNVHGPDVDLR